MIDEELASVRQLTHTLFKARARQDRATLSACYDPRAKYWDPLVGDLEPGEVLGLWPLMFSSTRCYRLCYRIDDIGLVTARVSSTVSYEFTAMSRPVQLDLRTKLYIRDGLVVRHDEEFDLTAWLSAAFGAKGRFMALWPPCTRTLRQDARALISLYRHAGRPWVDYSGRNAIPLPSSAPARATRLAVPQSGSASPFSSTARARPDAAQALDRQLGRRLGDAARSSSVTH